MADTIDLREVLTDRIRVLYRHMKEHAAEIMEKHDRHFPPRILAWDAEGNETMEEFVEGPTASRIESGGEALRRLALESQRLGLIYLDPNTASQDGAWGREVGEGGMGGDSAGEHLCLRLFDRKSPFQVDLEVPLLFENGKCVFDPPAVTAVRPTTSLVE